MNLVVEGKQGEKKNRTTSQLYLDLLFVCKNSAEFHQQNLPILAEDPVI